MRHEKALTFAMTVSSFPQSMVAPIDFTGTWKNELGSTMTVKQTGHTLTGKYQSVVSGGGSSIIGDLSGWVSERLISFSVNWTSPSITSWVGHLVMENGQDVIETLWQMTTAMKTPSDPTELWESVFAGADRFERT